MRLTDKMPPESRPNPASGAGVKLEAYESLDDEGRKFIDQFALEVASLVHDGEVKIANEMIKEWFDGAEDVNTWMLALYWKLDSKTRSALKKSASQ
jgi:hypothetical protein